MTPRVHDRNGQRRAVATLGLGSADAPTAAAAATSSAAPEAGEDIWRSQWWPVVFTRHVSSTCTPAATLPVGTRQAACPRTLRRDIDPKKPYAFTLLEEPM